MTDMHVVVIRLPDRLRLTWPEDNPWVDKDVRPAGTPMGKQIHTHVHSPVYSFVIMNRFNSKFYRSGPIKVEILNKKGESMSRLPLANNAKKLSIRLKVVWHCM